jgi:hypothetical protein
MTSSGSAPSDPAPPASNEPASVANSQRSPSKSEREPCKEVRHRAPLARTRWTTVTVLLVCWLTMLLVSAFTSDLRVCSDEVARVGSTALAHSCGAMSLTDAPSLALLLIAGVLLLPDLSAFEILES